MTRPTLSEIVARIPTEVAAELRDALSARLDRLKPTFRARLDERDQAIRHLADDFYADAPSRQERARRLERDLDLARTRPPGLAQTGRAAALAQVLGLCDGRTPGKHQIENILAGRRR